MPEDQTSPETPLEEEPGEGDGTGEESTDVTIRTPTHSSPKAITTRSTPKTITTRTRSGHLPGPPDRYVPTWT